MMTFLAVRSYVDLDITFVTVVADGFRGDVILFPWELDYFTHTHFQ